MKKNPKVTEFVVTGQEKRNFHMRPGDTLTVTFREVGTFPNGKQTTISEVPVLTEKITEHMTTDDIFIARANIDGQPAKMGGFTIKKEGK